MPAPFVPYGDVDRKLMWQVLGIWAKSTSSRNSPVERDIRTEFPPLTHSLFTQRAGRASHPYHLDRTGWLIGEELTRQGGVVPVVTFEAFGSHEKVEGAAFRVALMSIVDGKLRAEGWRFEQAEYAEDDIAAHPYAHAQAIIGWRKDVDCLIHKPHAETDECDGIGYVSNAAVRTERIRAQQGTLVKHPAFPLGVKSLTGLALAVYTTLYGVPKARSVFSAVRGIISAQDDLREDISRLYIA